MQLWAPNSWHHKFNAQAIEYESVANLQRVVAELSHSPPLVTVAEIDTLKHHLAKAAAGQQFILQGGNCVETFAECETNIIAGQLWMLSQMGLVLERGLNKPIVKIGRLAGQYAKPRSANTEIYKGTELFSYRGDLINSIEPSLIARTPAPERLLEGYHCAARTLADIRALTLSELANEQADIQFYVSHEALHLAYEQALTRQVKNRWYNLATHFLWVGARTNQIDGAQIEYVRGLSNPIGIKIAPAMQPEVLVKLVELLNPADEPGRLVLINRLGIEHIQAKLPSLIEAIQASGRTVSWMLDPMHGNTRLTAKGIKTRYFSDVLAEIEQALLIHRAKQSYLAGIHLEMTAENVTECLGGLAGITEQDLAFAYKTLIDPRLNREQALELVTRMVALVNTP
ncbi:MAG: aroH [Gammaproteobacteria bacterium]|jgi:3-deoxy-7-phosphoheptulonate synthase|nr:aroH [Gammaproteobacteria bacterium]